jgi:pimeloyl-ACP methyl ester carboxylesterase
MLAIAALALQVALTPCPIDGVPGEVKCGGHSVWEDRESKSGRRIDLAIMVLAALEPNARPDPFFMLQGGPGDAPSFNARFYSRAFQEARKSRDLVLVDLRGTGKSAALTCPELAKPADDGTFDADLLSVPAVRACRQRLEQRADLRLYTTEIAVDDLEEVRQALRYPAINLYGTSYGSRVAQVYMRRYPQSLRAVVIKGVVPPSMAMPQDHARAGEGAWRALVRRCTSDASCNAAFPKLDAELKALLERLEQRPAQLTVPAASNQPGGTVRVTRGLFAEAFRNVLYTPESVARAPSLVSRLAGGDTRELAQIALAGRTVLGGDRLAAGFFLSVTCTEDIPYLSGDASALAAGTFGGDYRLQQQRAACQEWPRGAVSREHRRPVQSNIPTLLLSGELDPVTPPSGAEEVARTLTQGRHVVLRNNGHPIGNGELCINTMVAAFLDRGSATGIEASCAEAIPAVPFSMR